MKNFTHLLQKELEKLPYEKHVDDGQYNDGVLTGFEFGAIWAYELLTGKRYNNPKIINNLPRYVSLGNTEMKYDEDEDEYFRDAGNWSVKYKYHEGKLLSDCADMPWIHEFELKEITFDEWKAGNAGYV